MYNVQFTMKTKKYTLRKREKFIVESIYNLVQCLKQSDKTIAIMESCTGGGLANQITNIEGSSEVFKVGIVAYSTEAKIKMGVSKDTIERYSVYSMAVAKEMARAAANFLESTFGIGITGQIEAKAYVAIYSSCNSQYYEIEINLENGNRGKNKEMIINKIAQKLTEII